MQNIVINYKITKKTNDLDILETIIRRCQSDKYRVFLNIYDFSLNKQNPLLKIDSAKTSSSIISYHEKCYEDLNNADNIVLQNLIQHGDSLGYMLLPNNIILSESFFDLIDFQWLSHEGNGLIYFDYHINRIRCYTRSRAVNIPINTPAALWSTSKLIRHIHEKEKLQIVGNNYASLHIPHSLCTIYPYEE